MGFKAEWNEISAENIYTTYNFTSQNLFHVSNMGLQEICQKWLLQWGSKVDYCIRNSHQPWLASFKRTSSMQLPTICQPF